MDRLRQFPYHDRARALREIAQLSEALPPVVLNRFDLLLSTSPAPEEGLRYFARLHEQHPSFFQRLTRSTAGLRYLIAVFTYSPFLSGEILEHPEWAEQLLDEGDVHRVRTAEEIRMLLDTGISDSAISALELAKFRRKQMLRILIRDVLGFGTLPEITNELTALADAIVAAAYDSIRQRLITQFGLPLDSTGHEAQFSIITLGKMGGEELNYSSDIDLMFLYSANGETNGLQRITNKEFFKRAANELTDLLSTYTPEGMCYRVDLRLRPEGSLGEVAISLEGARDYYSRRARDWELQMLIKARAAAGDRATGRALLDYVEPLIYSTTLDFSAIEALSVTRERLNEKLVNRKRARKIVRTSAVAEMESIDVKLERGGIRDIEFLVQCLQRLYGGTEPWLRHGGTLLALARLHDKGFLSDVEYGRLASAYQFLRCVEHRLQFADDRQTHRVPTEEDEVRVLARRIPLGFDKPEWFLEYTRSQFAAVIEIYDRVIHARTPSRSVAEPQPEISKGGQPQSNIVLALEQRAPRLAAALSNSKLSRGYVAFQHLLERLWSDSSRLGRLNSDSDLALRTLDLFEHSPYLAEELIRTPELLDSLWWLDASAATASPQTATELRRWYRREMIRIQAASICLPEPVFETLERTSMLADAVIARAYEIAIRDVSIAQPPTDPHYEPAGQMWVIALGRLGMREFDLGSDADLVFVLADSDSGELLFWTKVAQRIVDLITAYTGEGMLFAVDTRLRPNGVDGPLVQTETAYKDYFDRTAEAWEGITYMKSRGVAGDPDRAEFFLHELQEVDWKRYGQSGRSRTDLRQMRGRLEKEQGAAHPLKAGRGGYYDIDFILMYLRLRSAGVFFKVLNTPARIDVLESMGDLTPGDAEFLRRAATFYRAVDHGIRMLTGHAEDRLPSAPGQMDALAELLRRWSPLPLSEAEEIRSRTRSLFERVFT